MAPARLPLWKGVIVLALGAVPVLLGFVAPAIYLLAEAWARYKFAGLSPQIVKETLNTVGISAVATCIVLVAGLVVAYTARLHSGLFTRLLGRISVVGYAIPGTVLAIGLLGPVSAIDGIIHQQAAGWFGIATGLVLLGSGAALVYAYTVRFLAISAGSVEAGFSRIPPSLDHAARTLGQTATGTFRFVHLPLSTQALAAAGLLVFVDCMKELPATLLLRPLNFETLSTHLYGEAARGTYEEASIAALIIVMIGILPVVFLARVGRKTA